MLTFDGGNIKQHDINKRQYQHDSASSKLFYDKRLDFEDKISDGFVLCRGFQDFPLNESRGQQQEQIANQEIVKIDLEQDSKLNQLLSEAVEKIQGENSTLLKAQIVAELVVDKLGGRAQELYVEDIYWSQVGILDSGTSILIGNLSIGQHIHRAVLFKFLCDSLGIQVRIQDVEFGVEVFVWEGDEEFAIDLMDEPGHLQKAEQKVEIEELEYAPSDSDFVFVDPNDTMEDIPIYASTDINLGDTVRGWIEQPRSKRYSSKNNSPQKAQIQVPKISRELDTSFRTWSQGEREGEKENNTGGEGDQNYKQYVNQENNNFGFEVPESIDKHINSNLNNPEEQGPFSGDVNDNLFLKPQNSTDEIQNQNVNFIVPRSCEEANNVQISSDVGGPFSRDVSSLNSNLFSNMQAQEPTSNGNVLCVKDPLNSGNSSLGKVNDQQYTNENRSPNVLIQNQEVASQHSGNSAMEVETGTRGNSVDGGVSLGEPQSPLSTVSQGSSRQIATPSELNKWIITTDELHDLRPLDKGSYGQVYLGQWNHTKVAIKKMFPPDHYDGCYNYDSELTPQEKKEFEDEFIREVLIMLSLSHENIVQFYGVVLDSEKQIVTEYVKHGSIYNLLHRQGKDQKSRQIIKSNLGLRLQMALHVARGVNYLHYKGILHLDLKTQNLLVGDEFKIKVCDFGLSRIKVQRMYQSKGTYGTPEYMAPEVLRDCEKSEKADIFSFGVVLYELATLLRPWENFSAPCVWSQVALQNKRLEIPENVDERIKGLILRCWVDEPSERPTFDQIIADLEKIMRDMKTVKQNQENQNAKTEG